VQRKPGTRRVQRLVVQHHPDTVSIAADNDGSGGISLAVDGGGNGSTVQPINALVLTTFGSNTDESNPDVLTNKSYSMTVHITDNSNGLTDDTALTFTGVFNGTMTNETFDVTHLFTDGTTKDVTLGTHKYTATVSYQAPGSPTSGENGFVSVTITVSDVTDSGGGNNNGGGEHPQNAPEPTSLVLASMTLPVFFAVRRRRMRA